MGFFDRFSKKKASDKPANRAEQSPYRGVEVVSHAQTCCQAAKDIRGKRFLSTAAPLLPLKDCDAADCRCSYKRFADRRTDARRASDVAFDIVGQFPDEEKRSEQPAGRRATD